MRISSYKSGSVALEKDEGKKYSFENQSHTQRRYWEKNMQGKSVEKKEEREDTGAKLEVRAMVRPLSNVSYSLGTVV